MTNRTDPAFLMIAAQCLLKGFTAGLVTSLLLCLLVLLTTPASAAVDTGFEELDTVARPADVQKGSLLFKHQGQLRDAPLLHTDVEMKVSGLIARTRLKQKFINTCDEWVEA
ncbi:MAG: hypothetical protein R3318_03725, partial [Gammaproteobacteria bacterium]|nr:hypothetical protein [Gammaproteobacteria bacterium]